MADKSISQLSSATTPLAGTETLPIVQGGSTVKTTVQDVADLAGGAAYKIWMARLTQSGTNNPTVEVLENTFTSPVTVTRVSQGLYNIVCSEFQGAAPNFFKAVLFPINTSDSLLRYQQRSPSPTTVEISTYDNFSLTPAVASDSLLVRTLVEIRVYP